MRPQIESGGLHKETGGGGRWRERGGEARGGRKKREKEGFGKCFSTLHHLSPHTHTAAVSIERTVARLKKREVKSLASVIKMPLILAPSSEQRENTSAQKVLTSNY